jgi:hypothetical protein
MVVTLSFAGEREMLGNFLRGHVEGEGEHRVHQLPSRAVREVEALNHLLHARNEGGCVVPPFLCLLKLESSSFHRPAIITGIIGICEEGTRSNAVNLQVPPSPLCGGYVDSWISGGAVGSAGALWARQGLCGLCGGSVGSAGALWALRGL